MLHLRSIPIILALSGASLLAADTTTSKGENKQTVSKSSDYPPTRDPENLSPAEAQFVQKEAENGRREVQLALPDLPRGWAYYPPMQRELKACIAEMQSKPPAPVCTQQAKILGLCK